MFWATPPMLHAASTTNTGVSSHRPRRGRCRRICRNIQTTSATSAGGHTQASVRRADVVRREDHESEAGAVIAAAGTAAHRCGCVVRRLESTAMVAQPMPNPRSREPVMTLSVAPGKTAKVRARAVTAPATREPKTTRVTPTVRGASVGVSLPGRSGCRRS